MSEKDAIKDHIQELKKHHEWLHHNMPSCFLATENSPLILEVAHGLIDLPKHDNFILLHLKNITLVITVDELHIDLKILKKVNYLPVYSYESYVSSSNLPNTQAKLYVAFLHHARVGGGSEKKTKPERDLLSEILVHYPEVSPVELYHVHDSLSPKILEGMNQKEKEELFHLITRSIIRDHLQFYLDDHLKLFFSWKNVPRNHFLTYVAELCKRHHLSIDHFHGMYVPLNEKDDLLVMHLHLKKIDQGFSRDDFLRELCFLKFGRLKDVIEDHFLTNEIIDGTYTDLLKAMLGFSHQFLVHADNNVYSLEHIEEATLRYPELTRQILTLFQHKFDPSNRRFEHYEKEKNHLLEEIVKIDSGNSSIDIRRKNVLKTLILFTDYCQKTNFYRENKCALSFRIDPKILNFTPYDRNSKFPELPFGIFFFSNKNFIGFQIRFKDLSRGGLRTVALPKEQTSWEINNVFQECYNLAYTQQKKNKDIPEGGSKAIIFCNIHTLLKEETEYLIKSQPHLSKDALDQFRQDFRWKIIYESQRAFIHSFLTLINCTENGELKAKQVIDYYRKPEYIYLGPDENMHNSMIDWIAEMSEKVGYKPKKAFISSKPLLGINHKEFGITSFGVHTCLKTVMHHLGMDPQKDPFTIKISGGPDGDVAGNEMALLIKEFPKTAKIIAITDGTGTIRDTKGLNFDALLHLFEKGVGIKFYPTELLSKDSFLLDITSRKEIAGMGDTHRLIRNENNKIIDTPIPASEASNLYRLNLLKVEADIFIPAGGRPRTLQQANISDFLDSHGQPTSKAIIEGANLYLTPEARHVLEQKGVIIIKDSSANKGGVVCSSFEVLCGLILSDEEFVENKRQIVEEILAFIESIALKETQLILKTAEEYNIEYAKASDLIAEKINFFSYKILDHLQNVNLSDSIDDPLNQCLVAHCLPILRRHPERILKNIPDIHKKAIIASFVGANTVYKNGLGWEPSIHQILPLIIKNLI
ncbi:MAG: NAD-glutamate dehydrogenase [Verrucomicrobia bacterium]|nr:NAD-glutamate dehydrogenase [Verrucomicrobiota bacterium]NDE62807.1 glutamate dehydrogenase [Chlamydiota bacterium]